MAAHNPPEKHDNPEIEWWLIGIRNAVVGEGEERMITQGFIGDAQIAQLVCRSGVAQ